MNRFSGRKVLLAEDSLISVVHTESVLKHLNLNIDVVRNGNDAVQKVKDSQYDILLINIKLPGINGLEAAKKIRSMGYNREDLPILAITAYDISMDLLNMSGISDIILKPFSGADLESKLYQYLNKD